MVKEHHANHVFQIFTMVFELCVLLKENDCDIKLPDLCGMIFFSQSDSMQQYQTYSLKSRFRGSQHYHRLWTRSGTCDSRPVSAACWTRSHLRYCSAIPLNYISLFSVTCGSWQFPMLIRRTVFLHALTVYWLRVTGQAAVVKHRNVRQCV